MEPLLWNIEKVVSKGDYNYCIVRNHPNRTKNNYVLHHRAVMENHLGRLLTADEVVHHKNEIKKDNRIENLEVLTASDHRRLHMPETGRTMFELKCPECSTVFVKEKRQTHIGKKKGSFTCCSRSCRGKLSRKMQLNRETSKVESAISVNILREFNSLDNPEETAL
jgi:hypothetical protein